MLLLLSIHLLRVLLLIVVLLLLRLLLLCRGHGGVFTVDIGDICSSGCGTLGLRCFCVERRLQALDELALEALRLHVLHAAVSSKG